MNGETIVGAETVRNGKRSVAHRFAAGKFNIAVTKEVQERNDPKVASLRCARCAFFQTFHSMLKSAAIGLRGGPRADDFVL